MHHLILKQPVSCGESRASPPNHLLGLGSLGLSVTKKAFSHFLRRQRSKREKNNNNNSFSHYCLVLTSKASDDPVEDLVLGLSGLLRNKRRCVGDFFRK